ncbi:prophage LambdaCh01, recombination protein U [Carboxydothermus hydrogenoformans Z-2901]|uniref:Holliday junction resolvase RecU n=2 Tax=Carboxydothermus hydrogenoformans TaxID=129958 RepID=Q3ABI0_CARHZ|nr:prophage LambdaCh01, recombination protein U [Carboxydothermus hydrogenoformans Z-2901]
MANRQYRAQRRAVIHKVPTAWIPLRDSRGRIVTAKVEEKAAVDFLGTYRGRSLAFDAKHCAGERIRWDRVEDHQAQFLEDWTRDGGISFILVGFNMSRFFVVPWEFWRDGIFRWKYEEGPASISIKQMCPEWETRLGGRATPDYLAVVDKLWFGGEESGYTWWTVQRKKGRR